MIANYCNFKSQLSWEHTFIAKKSTWIKVTDAIWQFLLKKRSYLLWNAILGKIFLREKKFAAKVKNQNVWPKATSILEPSSISMTSILLIFILKSYFTIIFSF